MARSNEGGQASSRWQRTGSELEGGDKLTVPRVEEVTGQAPAVVLSLLLPRGEVSPNRHQGAYTYIVKAGEHEGIGKL